jgi:hypothetical protein
MNQQPIGLIPWRNWSEQNPEPTLRQVVNRYADVLNAVERYRNAGRPVDGAWLMELGLAGFVEPMPLFPFVLLFKVPG